MKESFHLCPIGGACHTDQEFCMLRPDKATNDRLPLEGASPRGSLGLPIPSVLFREEILVFGKSSRLAPRLRTAAKRVL